MSLQRASWIGILDGMISVLQPITAQTGVPMTPPNQILRQVGRYCGEFDGEKALEGYGISGRTPAVLVDFAGEKSVTMTVGRRRQKVEGSFVAIVCTDAHRTPEDRNSLLAVIERVRIQLVSRRLGLDITPLWYKEIIVYRELPQLAAYGVVFATQYWLDLSHAPGDLIVGQQQGHQQGGQQGGGQNLGNAPEEPLTSITGTITDPAGHQIGDDKITTT
jgi:hypothetical protein